MNRKLHTLRLAAIVVLFGSIPSAGSSATTEGGLEHLRRAWVHAGHDDWEPAAKEAATAVVMLRGKRALPEALEVLGLAELQLGRPAQAADHAREGLGACEQCEERIRLRAVLAAAYRDLRRFEEAETILRKLLAEAEAKGSVDDQVLSLKSLASVVVSQGRRAEALPLLQELIRREDEAGKPGADRAQNLGAIGVLLTETGDGAQALNYLRPAEALAELTNDQPHLLQIHTNIAKAYVELGRLDQALALFGEVEAASRRSGNEAELARSLCGSAEILRMRGRPDEAQKRFEESLELDKRNGRIDGQVRALNQLAEIDLQAGRYSRAFSRFEEATEISRDLADPQSEFTSIARSADVFLKLNQDREGFLRMNRAREVGRELTKGDWAAETIFTILQLFQENRLDEAIRQTDLALEQALRIGSKRLEVELLEIRASLHLTADHFEEGHRDAEAALALSRTFGDRNKEAELNFLLGFIAIRGQRYSEALPSLEQALRFEREVANSGPRSRTLWLLGATYENLQNSKAAIASYREAVEIIESGLTEVRADDFLAGLAETAVGAYGRWANLLARSGDAEAAFGITERARSRMFLRRMGNPPPELRKAVDPALLQEEDDLHKRIEALTRQIRERERKASSGPDEGLAELARSLDEARRDFGTLRIRIQQANPAYATLALPSPLTAPEVQKVLGGETTLVEYLLLEDTSLAWVIERDSVHVIRLTANGNQLANRIEELRLRIATREPAAQQSFLLYLDLFKPLVPFIHHKNVIVVPHGTLHSLPFGALTPDVGKTWLAERYAFSVLPSASVLPFVLAQRNGSVGNTLALGDPDGTLPAAASEARAVAALYGAKALVGPEATAAALRYAPRPIGILHLATHAAFDPVRPLFSRIRLADGELSAHDILNLDLHGTRLVVLSGCETAVGPSDVGELEGLSRAFLYAGASAVAATLWKVDDEASRALMLAFYRHLRAGTPTAEALRLAQVEILRDREEWHHPYYWAAFLLTGDPGFSSPRQYYPEGSQ